MTTTFAPAPTWQASPATLPRTFALDIEWRDICDGIGNSTHECPVARALTRWLFDHGIHVTDISVNRESAEIVVDWHQPSVRYFHTGSTFIRTYDFNQHVDPTTVAFVKEPAR